ncbi:hypothetical protein L228DRAFT_265636 [Xylona heveae TC161]|uniref:Uncharacterized protein n=1 Tax=Xylona heveae (strain CBS 132557 / TC161) TaxID=1328760 RepID=A0A165INQ1_XYLHT|nr:hypothetical protein L228DRAFT_265636 [Xylona heveae TC161]KZF25162.1 hypothetical protein L228DRAFT_265636 [Xylona heveae TC161]
MPVYLLHGFRWPRASIRIHIILQNLDDAAAEWTIAPGSSESIIGSFHNLYPETMASLPHLRLVEQHDEKDLTTNAVTQPYVFVADKVHTCNLSCDVAEVMGEGVPPEQWGALVELRDQLAPKEKVGWFVVYNGDEERSMTVDDDENDENDEGTKSRRALRKWLGAGGGK